MKNLTLCALTIAAALTTVNPDYAVAADKKPGNVYLPSVSKCYDPDKILNKVSAKHRYKKGEVTRLEFKVKYGEKINVGEFGERKDFEQGFGWKIDIYSNNNIGNSIDASLTTAYNGEQSGYLNGLAPSCQQNYDKIKTRIIIEPYRR